MNRPLNQDRDANRSLWNEITKDNPLRTEMPAYDERVRAMVQGRTKKSQMIIGPPGCGKGYALEQAIIAGGKTPYKIGKVSHNELPRILQECSEAGMIAVIDDNDDLLQDLSCMQIIATAISSENDAFGRTAAARTMTRDESFVFDLVMGITSNLDPRDPRQVSRPVAAYWKKFERRLDITRIDATEDQRYDFMCWQVICHGALRRKGYSTAAINEMLEVHWEFPDRVRDRSLGGFTDDLDKMASYPTTWRQQVIGEKRREAQPKRGPKPMIVAADRIRGKQASAVQAPIFRTADDLAVGSSTELRHPSDGVTERRGKADTSDVTPDAEDASLAAAQDIAVPGLSDVTADLERFRVEVEQLREQRDAMHRENEDLRARLVQAEQDVAARIASETQHQTEVCQLTERLETSQRELAEAKGRLDLLKWANGKHEELIPAVLAQISFARARTMDILLRRLFTDGGPEQQNAIEILKSMVESEGVDIYTISFDWTLSRLKSNQKIMQLEGIIRELRKAAEPAAAPMLRRRRV